jgi:hypothetical protein
MNSTKPLTHGCLVEYVHSVFLVEIGGPKWMGVVHGGIVVDTLPWVPNHS